MDDPVDHEMLAAAMLLPELPEPAKVKLEDDAEKPAVDRPPDRGPGPVGR